MDFSNPRRGSSRSRLLGTLPLTSMVDVIFILLIYFLLTISYTPPEGRLTPALQAERVSAGRAADLEPQVIHVERTDGIPTFRVGTRVFQDPQTLTTILESLPKEAGVFVKGYPTATVDAAHAALQSAYDAGFIRVTYVPGD